MYYPIYLNGILVFHNIFLNLNLPLISYFLSRKIKRLLCRIAGETAEHS